MDYGAHYFRGDFYEYGRMDGMSNDDGWDMYSVSDEDQSTNNESDDGWDVFDDRMYGTYNNTERSFNNGYNDVNQFRPSSNSTIFADRENTHDSVVQQSITQSLKNLLASGQPTVTVSDIMGSDIGELTKGLITQFCSQPETHYHTGINYKTLLLHVWQRILESEYQQNLFKILRKHIWEAKGRCFTGIFNHTLSVLVGFCDDIQIQISDSARIGSIIVAARQGMDVYSTQGHHDLAREQLFCLGYDEETIEPWLAAILDGGDSDSEDRPYTDYGDSDYEDAPNTDPDGSNNDDLDQCDYNYYEESDYYH